MKRYELYEYEVAEYINTFPNTKATRPKVDSTYSDIKIEYKNNTSWLEVKMNHTDNLGNTRVFYDGDTWCFCGEPSPLKEFSVNILNNSLEVNNFVFELGEYTGIDNIKIPTTKGGLKDPNAPSIETMKEFFSDRSQYICQIEDIDLGSLVTNHYVFGKTEPAHYISAGNDFYFLGNQNPLSLSNDIPEFSGYGTFKMRVSTRTHFYEIQPEIKLKSLPKSDFSVKPGTDKLSPFLL